MKEDTQIKVIAELIRYHQQTQMVENPFNHDRESLIQQLVAAHLLLQRMLRKEREVSSHAAA